MVINSAYQQIINNNSDKNSDELMSSKTFELASGHASGWIDQKKAIEQAIKKIIFTDRYRWKIYSSSYGIDLDQFIGKDFSYVQIALQKEIERALSYDDRVLSIKDFKLLKVSIDQCICSFTVNTVFGIIKIQGEL